MTFLDALWHLLGFLAPAPVVAAITALLARWMWRRTLSGVSLARLVGWATAASVAALVVALAAFGRDGTMAGYASMLLACAVALWWAGLRRSR